MIYDHSLLFLLLLAIRCINNSSQVDLLTYYISDQINANAASLLRIIRIVLCVLEMYYIMI